MRKAALLIALVGVTLAASMQPASAQFSVRCLASHQLMDDPIVVPGVPGAAHMHDFFGNRSTDAFSSYATMVASGTTCRFSKDTAGYWAPALVIGDTVQGPVAINAYYRPPNQYVDNKAVVAFPADFKMLAGGDTVADPVATYWSCDDQAATRTTLPGNCGSTKTVHANVSFPSCWDGVNTDSLDHRSHVTYPALLGGCPPEFPVMIPRLTIIVQYAVHNGTGATLSSGDATTLHADFWNTWQQAALVAQVDRCIHVRRKCLNLRG
jgi:hypothetical protein